MINQEYSVVRIDHIETGERYREDMGDIMPLVDSIKEQGLIHPIAVKRLSEDKFLLLAGGRRLHAHKILKFPFIAVTIFPQSINEEDVRTIELMENIMRKDMTWQEEVDLKSRIHELQVEKHGEKVGVNDDEGWSKTDTAKLLGVDKSTLSRDLKLQKAMVLIPELADNKDKSNALKSLKKLENDLKLKTEIERRKKEALRNNKESSQQKLIDSYIVNDFLEYVKNVDNGIIDLVELDPPYGINLEKVKKNSTSTGHTLGTADYNEVDQSEYIDFMRKVLTECYRVMKPNSWILCWFAFEPWFQPVHDLLREVGFKGIRVPALWIKNTGQTPLPVRYLGSSHEGFFYMTKGSPKLAKMGGPNVFYADTPKPHTRIHPTERPVHLMEEILSTFIHEYSNVMVPFLGSGNTLLASNNLKHNAFGCDLSETYKDKFTKRVLDGQLGGF